MENRHDGWWIFWISAAIEQTFLFAAPDLFLFTHLLLFSRFPSSSECGDLIGWQLFTVFLLFGAFGPALAQTRGPFLHRLHVFLLKRKS